MIAAEGLTESEYERIIELLGRQPNLTELGVFGVMWSEHCSYKNSRALLQDLPTEGEDVLQGPGENAGVIALDEAKALAFKIESHNHPSAIEPYQGAATGVGGIIRDIFTMGARPIALLNSLRFGMPGEKRTDYLLDQVTAGIAGYGNSIGVPTVGGETFFAESYQDNPLVNAMAVGLLDRDNLTTGAAAGIGNPVMIVGAATGRDGIQGASFASEELSEDSEKDRPAVQIGDPFMEKLLLEASLELIESGSVIGIQDMGAAGLTSSAAEMAARAGTGVTIDVAKVPTREQGMIPYEILLSESQERMLVVPKKGQEEQVTQIFSRWGLNSAVIGEVKDDGYFRILEDGKEVAAIPAEILVDQAPRYVQAAQKPKYIGRCEQEFLDFLVQTQKKQEEHDYDEILTTLIGSPNLVSREPIYTQYDHMVQTNTVILPGADAAVLRIKDSNIGISLTVDNNSRYSYLDPRRGAEHAVAEAARNISCTGAKPAAITDGLNFGSPEKPEIYWQLKESIQGLAEACREFATPVTGGNVSLYNESQGKAIYPTPVVGMVGICPDWSKAINSDFKNSEDFIYLLGDTRSSLAASEYLAYIQGLTAGRPLAIDYQMEKQVQKLCQKMIAEELLNSAHDVSSGGLALALAESMLGSEDDSIGIEIDIVEELTSRISESEPPLLAALFGEGPGRIIVSTPEANADKLADMAADFDVNLIKIGKVTSDAEMVIAPYIRLDRSELIKSWQGEVFPWKI
ncbi:MAG: phosphoribosylformylglycinamidine synthase subunit PurL [Bacillota bacterium]